MGIRITDHENVALYNSTDGNAFGVTFPSKDHAEDFIEWARTQRHIPVEDGYKLDKLNRREFEALFVHWYKERVDDDGYLLERPREMEAM